MKLEIILNTPISKWYIREKLMGWRKYLGFEKIVKRTVRVGLTDDCEIPMYFDTSAEAKMYLEKYLL